MCNYFIMAEKIDRSIDTWFFMLSQPQRSYPGDTNVVKKTRSNNQIRYLHHIGREQMNLWTFGSFILIVVCLLFGVYSNLK